MSQNRRKRIFWFFNCLFTISFFIPQYLQAQSCQVAYENLSQLPSCNSSSGQGKKLCRYYRGALFKYRSQKQVFRQGYVYASPNFFKKKCQDNPERLALDLYFPGTGGSYIGRLHDEYIDNDCRISLGVHYNKEGDDTSQHTYKKIRYLDRVEQREILEDYVSTFLNELSKVSCQTPKKVAIMGHSQGGIMTSLFAGAYSAGTIPLQLETGAHELTIQGYFNADAGYFKNFDFLATLLIHRAKKLFENTTPPVVTPPTQPIFFPIVWPPISIFIPSIFRPIVIQPVQRDYAKELEDLKEKIVEEYKSHYPSSYPSRKTKYTQSTLYALFDDIFLQAKTTILQKIEDGTFNSWNPPKLFTSAVDYYWAHQAGFHNYGSSFQTPNCGKDGIRYIAYKFGSSNQDYWATQLWEELKATTGNSYHWIASSHFMKQAIKYLDQDGLCD